MIEDAPVKIQYIGNGVTQTVTFPFRIYRSEDLQVISTFNGDDTVLEEGEGYTFLTGENVDGGGSILLSAPIEVGELITLVRITPPSQDLDLNPKQDFPAESTETQLDRMSMSLQELKEKFTRCIHYRVTESDVELPFLELPDYIARSGKLLGFDGNGHLKLYTIDIDTLTVELNLVIPNNSITEAKLEEFLDLSAHVVTLADGTVTAPMLASSLDLHNKTVVLPEGSIGDPQVLPYALSRESLNPTLRPMKVAVGYDATALSIKVTGAGDLAANRTYLPSGTINGRTRYVADNGYFIAAEAGTKKWVLFDAAVNALYSSEHKVWGSFSSAIETTPDQMPPWVVYGTSNPGPTVTVETYDLDVKGTVRADKFIGPFETTGGGGSTSSQEDTVVMFPTNGNISRVGGHLMSGGYGGFMFLGGRGYLRYLGFNDASDKPFNFTAVTSNPFPLYKRLTPGILATASVTAICDGAGNTISLLKTGTLNQGNIIKIVQCAKNAFVLTDTGLVFAIGRNNDGQLGQNNTTNSSVFVGVRVGAVSGKTIFIKDINATSCQQTSQGVTVAAIDIDGHVWMWGDNSNGQCGAAVGDKLVPFNNAAWAFNAASVKQVMVLDKSSYVLTTLGAVYGTGLNSDGQLGDGSLTQRTNFVLMTNTGGSIIVATMHGAGLDGTTTFLALTTGGDVYGCGYGFRGLLGDGSSNPAQQTLVAAHSSINGAQAVKRLFVIGITAYAIMADGSVLTWGANTAGVQGNGLVADTYQGTTPTGLSALLGVPTDPNYISDIVMSGYLETSSNIAVYILTSDGKVFAAGDNTYGQLGADKQGTSQLTFTQLELPFTPTHIFGGNYGTAESRVYFRDNTGKLWVAGNGSATSGALGQIGSTVASLPLPVRI